MLFTIKVVEASGKGLGIVDTPEGAVIADHEPEPVSGVAATSVALALGFPHVTISTRFASAATSSFITQAKSVG